MAENRSYETFLFRPLNGRKACNHEMMITFIKKNILKSIDSHNTITYKINYADTTNINTQPLLKEMTKKILNFGLIILIVQLLASPVSAEKMYTWVDKYGKTRRTYYPPPADQVASQNQNVVQPQAQPKAQPRRQTRSQPKVELYVTSWCGYCKKAKEYFKAKNIAVQVYDIEKDSEAARRKSEMDQGQRGVPLAVINGIKIHGFSPQGYEAALQQ